MRISLIFTALLLSACGIKESPSAVSARPTIKALDKIFVDRNTDFRCMLNAGYQAFIVGFMPGHNVVDIQAHLERIDSVGMIPSAYFSLSSAGDARYFDTFVEQVRAVPSIKTVFLDLENRVSNIDQLSNDWYNKVCVEAGFKCGVYTNTGGMSATGFPRDHVTPLSEMYLWYASWGSTPNPFVTLGDEFWDWPISHGHQYKNGQLCGTEVDFNLFDARVF